MTLSSSTAQKPAFTAPTLAIGAPSQVLVFSLVVTDQRGGVSVADTVQITVTAPANTIPGQCGPGSDCCLDCRRYPGWLGLV